VIIAPAPNGPDEQRRLQYPPDGGGWGGGGGAGAVQGGIGSEAGGMHILKSALDSVFV
jgi:hypothetical protein